MLKREWGAESNGKLPHLFIPSKSATLVTESAVENLHLDRTLMIMMINVNSGKLTLHKHYFDISQIGISKIP